MNESIDAAVAAWREALGQANVVTSAESLDRASTATFPTNASVVAILRPGTHDEVRESLRIANRFELPVYPTSRGCNWGLGSSVPTRDAVLLDLSRMNRIVDFDPRLGFLVVEPGVTFQQASEFLRDQQSTFFLPVPGGPPQGSLIGNVAERGEAAGPYGQRADFVANMQAVLANGDCVHTGFGRFSNASAKQLHRDGVGPNLEGLFTQSNLAVITQLTVWLTPSPQVLKPFMARIGRRDELNQAIDTSRELLLHRVVETNGIGLWNSHKMASTMGGYPWQAMDGKTPVDIERFPSEPWLIGGAIYAASPEIADATAKLVQQRLNAVTSDWQWGDSNDSQNVYLGVPTEHNIRSAYWRKKGGLPTHINPDRDRCGLIWMCFAVPLVGQELVDVINAVEPVALQHGFEPNLGMNCVNGRCAHLYLSIIYDREIAGEDKRAVACHDQVMTLLRDLGHLPYRLTLLSMDSLPKSQDDHDRCVQSIKRALDPKSILAPGRYDVVPD
ncbi:FAD-binding oxidoreductase [Planctomycetes bacterium TBK1r]|uniref:4-cresol dehydrogenase [hydroxylating] flavoprotein subunit n=1 Tax=Stieleria magnilauensis TaxID=2527963 RepID=A0ABX5XRT9_9BACT|nr:4-cresol dehydrogenase [hydroxylating] flavoprotein subunit [Planctomycetes bacterium TBK1r]